jgi:arylsulfatase
MEVYAALLDNADQNVGRLTDFLRLCGALDNTLICLTSDNGANAVAGPKGVMNLVGRRVGATEDMALNMRLLHEDRIGGEDTYICYPTGWTQLSNSPYRYFKRTPMAGGIRVPLVMHWPAGIADPGSLRRQWVHVTDLLPTIMDYTGTSLPETFNGKATQSLDGMSFTGIVANASASACRSSQYYELQGSRAFISGDWKIVSLQTPDKAIDLDNWMLFNLALDPAEIDDLATKHPEIVRRLIEEFDAQAGINYVYPVDTRDERRNYHVPPYEVERMLAPRDFFAAGPSIPSLVVSPLICDRSYTLSARFDWAPAQSGVIFSIGDRFCGMVLYIEEGALFFVYQWWHAPTVVGPIALVPGAQTFELRYRAEAGRRGSADLLLNGGLASKAIELSPTMLKVPSSGLSVGLSRRLSVSERHADRGSFAYTGTIDRIHIEPGELAPGSILEPSEAKAQARMRAATA